MAGRLYNYRSFLIFPLLSVAVAGMAAVTLAQSALGQDGTKAPMSQTPASTPAVAAPQSHRNADAKEPALTEEDIKHLVAGKTLYLRNGYLDNSLHFDESGTLKGTVSQAPYTLSLVEINKVRLTKHRVELQGIRYGIHFTGESPTTDLLSASDKLRITPKKKVLTITIDRAGVVKQKKSKDKKVKSKKHGAKGAGSESTAAGGQDGAPAQPSAEAMAAETQARANQVLRNAIDNVFAREMDERMVGSLPDYWKLYYQAAAARKDYRPSDPTILRQSQVDQKARLLSNFQQPTNDFAQDAGVVGVAQYHVVVQPDGKSGEIAIGRPIGFGLDESAVASIRKATFQPAIKGGQPVPVMLDLVVQFRIFSNKTASASNVAGSASVENPVKSSPPLPGPYSVNLPAPKQP